MAVMVTRGKDRLTKAVELTREPLLANAGYLTGIDLVGSVVGFVFWGLAARLYQPEDVGTASVVLSAVALVSGIAGLGMGTGLVRFLPEVRSPRRLLNTALTCSIGTAFLTCGVFLAGLPVWSPSLVALQRNGLYAVGFLAYVVAATLGSLVSEAFVAHRQASYALIHTCVVNICRLLLVAVLAGLGTVGLVGSVALAVVLALTLSLWGLLPRVDPGYRPRPGVSWANLVAVIPYSLGNYVAGLLAQTSQTVIPLMTMEILGPASSGYAYIALMVGSLLTSPGVALAGSAFAEGSNAPQKLLPILTRAAALGLALTVPVALILCVCAPYFLLLFGPRYAREAAGLLRWLALAAPLIVLSRLYFTHLRVQKQIGRLILLSGIVAAATLGVAAVLMPRLGIAANGVGLLVGHSLVAAVASGRWMRQNGPGGIIRRVGTVSNIRLWR